MYCQVKRWKKTEESDVHKGEIRTQPIQEKKGLLGEERDTNEANLQQITWQKNVTTIPGSENSWNIRHEKM